MSEHSCMSTAKTEEIAINGPHRAHKDIESLIRARQHDAAAGIDAAYVPPWQRLQHDHRVNWSTPNNGQQWDRLIDLYEESLGDELMAYGRHSAPTDRNSHWWWYFWASVAAALMVGTVIALLMGWM